MPINKETIISVFDEKLTLMQWLKTINKALEDAVLTGVEINKKGNATLSFKFTFEDGTFLETNDIVLQQGESVNGAYIQNGHLYLTLTNSQTLDAGNVKPVSNFSINASQHLIVNYADGTNQDLGAIFQGNVNISGTLNATKITGDEIVETMPSGYNFSVGSKTNLVLDMIYVSAVKNGNKLTIVTFGKIKRTGTISDDWAIFGSYGIPYNIGIKLYPYELGAFNNVLDTKVVSAFDGLTSSIGLSVSVLKNNNTQLNLYVQNLDNLVAGTDYIFRHEVTFLLSDNFIN